MSTGASAFWRHLPCGGATYWRVVGEGWTDAADTSYSKKFGGRWNPSGTFGVLYLNAAMATAKANAVRHLAGHGLEIEDLLPGLWISQRHNELRPAGEHPRHHVCLVRLCSRGIDLLNPL